MGAGNLFSSMTAFANLVDAWRLASRGKGSRLPVARFAAEMDTRLVDVKLALETGVWTPGAHRQFLVYDPKFRRIAAPPFADRVVHHAICAVIEPLFERRFIYDSYACRVDKGTHRGVRRLQSFLRKRHAVYALKCDISKFFASIDHAVLCQIIRQTISDPKLLDILDRIIAGFFPGIPIGNLTSQLFANVYLDQLDHFVKEELRIKYYLRYMDDFVILGENKRDLTNILDAIRTFLTNTLKLSLHPRKVRLFPTRLGVDFVGYVVFADHILLRQKLFASPSLRAFSPIPSSVPGKTQIVYETKTSKYTPPAKAPAKPANPRPIQPKVSVVQLCFFDCWPE